MKSIDTKREAPRRKETPANILEKYLKRNLNGAGIRRVQRDVMVKYNAKHYRCWWDEDAEHFLVKYWDPELGSTPVPAKELANVRAVIMADKVKGEPEGYVP